MFHNLHLDIYQLVFDYLPQQDLLNILLINRTFYQQIMKYIDKLCAIENNRDLRYVCKMNAVISLKLNEYILDWNWGLRGACEGDHIRLVEQMIAKGANKFSSELFADICKNNNEEIINIIIENIMHNCINKKQKLIYLNNGLYGACLTGNMKFAELVIEKGAYGWDAGLRGACKGNNKKFAEWMIDKGANIWPVALSEACKSGHKDIVEWLINEKGVNSWEWGLEGACEGGYKEIAEWMINKGATNWNFALSGACRNGNKELVEWVIQKGANDWNWGLRAACARGHKEIVILMIEKGSNDWKGGLREACFWCHPELVKLMIEKGATYCKNCKTSAKQHLQKTPKRQYNFRKHAPPSKKQKK